MPEFKGIRPGQMVANGPVPRVIHQNERVVPGSSLKRFKVRAVNFDLNERVGAYTYILAANQVDAERCYVEAYDLRERPPTDTLRLTCRALDD